MAATSPIPTMGHTLTSRLVPSRKIRGTMATSSSRPSEMARLTV